MQQLRDQILAGQLDPGQSLEQSAIAAQFGTSRLPVREALRELQKEGLVVVQPNSGARVARLDAEELDEVYWLREHLEPLAVERSAPNFSDEDIASLRRSVADMESCSRDELQKWLELDRTFHFRGFAGIRRPRLMNLVEGFWNVAQLYRRAYITLRPEIMELANVEHRLILEALERRSGEDASRLLEVHIRRTRIGLANYPEIFGSIAGHGQKLTRPPR